VGVIVVFISKADLFVAKIYILEQRGGEVNVNEDTGEEPELVVRSIAIMA
jgi:hypothetical protein